MLIVKKNQNAIPNKRIYCDATSVTNLLTGLPPTLGVALALDIHQRK